MIGNAVRQFALRMWNDLFDIATVPTGDGARPWSYRRAPASNWVESARVCGTSVALPPHFHEEDQITFVLEGRRRFVLGDEHVTLVRGEGAVIRAGTIHASLAEPDGVLCFNLYLRAPTDATATLLAHITQLWHRRLPLSPDDIMSVLYSSGDTRPPLSRPTTLAPTAGVSATARAKGLSREAFSRKFRRAHGLPPSLYAGLTKLNAARELLRAGEAPAAVAADTGFADQSHLGRAFRRAFGVPPGLYRTGP